MSLGAHPETPPARRAFEWTPSPDADEAAAVAAAIARFEADTAPTSVAGGEAIDPWQRAALIEGVGAKASIQDLDQGGLKWLS
jgi:hypothetical protein